MTIVSGTGTYFYFFFFFNEESADSGRFNQSSYDTLAISLFKSENVYDIDFFYDYFFNACLIIYYRCYRLLPSILF